MSLLLSLILITSIWCLGLTVVSVENMILFDFRLWAEKKYAKGYKIFAPIITCIYCMPSIHTMFGIAIAFLLGVLKIFTYKIIFLYPVVALGSSFLNGIVWEFFSLMTTIREYYEELNHYNPDLIEEEQETKEHYRHLN